jgi:predicted nucleic acid-binding protein
MGEALQNNVFIDTNVLINDFFYRIKDKQLSKPAHLAIVYLKSKPKVSLFIASFSVIQLISTLDKAKVSKTEIANEVKRILSRYKLIDLTAKDIEKALSIEYKDTEDAIQYTLCRKARCLYIVTDNVKDFNVFNLVSTIKPKSIRDLFLG